MVGVDASSSKWVEEVGENLETGDAEAAIEWLIPAVTRGVGAAGTWWSSMRRSTETMALRMETPGSCGCTTTDAYMMSEGPTGREVVVTL